MKEKLKVLIIHDYAFVEGGAGKVAIETAVGLAERGHEVKYFCAVGPVSSYLKDVPLKEIVLLDQKDILTSGRIKAAFSGAINKTALRELGILINHWKPDIAHIHIVSKALSWAVISHLSRRNISIIYTLHDFGLLCPNMSLYNFKTGKQCGLYDSRTYFKCLLTNCDKRTYGQKLWRWSRFIYSRKILKALDKIDGFIAVSDFEAEIFKKFIPSKAVIRVIYNPLGDYKNPDKLYNAEDSFMSIRKHSLPEESGCDKFNIAGSDERLQFIYTGRLSEEKGIRMLLDVFENIDAKLLIAGDGDLKELCNKKASRLGKDRIEVLGILKEDELAEILKKCRALILPSIVKETAGLAVLEAARHSIPSIVSGHGGLKEFVHDNIDGLYFEAGNRESLVDAVQRFIDEPELSRKLGRNAYIGFEKYPGKPDNYFSQLENFYYDIILNHVNK
jgi:glycosyltransferase involved in cell wall biosynthesis